MFEVQRQRPMPNGYDLTDECATDDDNYENYEDYNELLWIRGGFPGN